MNYQTLPYLGVKRYKGWHKPNNFGTIEFLGSKYPIIQIFSSELRLFKFDPQLLLTPT
jgi:hypothetical protein